MPKLSVGNEWSAEIQVTKDVAIQNQGNGIVYVTWGAAGFAPPSDVTEGFMLDYGKAVVVKGGQAFRCSCSRASGLALYLESAT